MAYLNARPKPDERSKRAKIVANAPRLSRLDQMKKDGVTPKMPPNPAPGIVTRLVEIGLTEANGMGVSPLSWREIDAWCSLTGVVLPPWEARLIRSLSTSYIAEGHRAESEACTPPWRAEVTQREIKVAEARLRAVLG